MILKFEEIHAIKFQLLVIVPFSETKIHHVALQGIISENYFIIQTLIFTIHYEHSF
jgi:hypothetical protein